MILVSCCFFVTVSLTNLNLHSHLLLHIDESLHRSVHISNQTRHLLVILGVVFREFTHFAFDSTESAKNFDKFSSSSTFSLVDCSQELSLVRSEPSIASITTLETLMNVPGVLENTSSSFLMFP